MELAFGRSESGSFSGAFSSKDLLDTRFSRVAADRHYVSRERAAISRDASEHVLLSMLLEGEVTISQGDREARLVKGDIAIYDTTQPHRFVVTQPFAQVLVRLRRSEVIERVGHLNDLTARKLSSSRGMGLLISNLLHDVDYQLDHISAGAMRVVNTSMLDLICSGFGEIRTESHAHLREHQYRLMMRILAFVDQHLCDSELNCAVVATHFRISERYLRKLFSEGERSLSERIWHQRLEEAKRRLSAQGAFNKSITSVAFECGFKDTAHFSRAFKDKYGMTPREHRQRAVASQH
ncbi:hypothetical protein YGS_C1P2758 [Sphingobium sp. YG1]|nr:hypothetical protein YGS_C1P2758 [Sphingobium sp. YG1]